MLKTWANKALASDELLLISLASHKAAPGKWWENAAAQRQETMESCGRIMQQNMIKIVRNCIAALFFASKCFRALLFLMFLQRHIASQPRLLTCSPRQWGLARGVYLFRIHLKYTSPSKIGTFRKIASLIEHVEKLALKLKLNQSKTHQTFKQIHRTLDQSTKSTNAQWRR